MKEELKNTNQFIGKDVLEKLREVIPKHYYKDFSRLWSNKHKKSKITVPSRQHVYEVLQGNSENDLILDVLVDLAEERKVLKNKLLSITHGQGIHQRSEATPVS